MKLSITYKEIENKVNNKGKFIFKQRKQQNLKHKVFFGNDVFTKHRNIVNNNSDIF
jgi:hypothetical protein